MSESLLIRVRAMSKWPWWQALWRGMFPSWGGEGKEIINVSNQLLRYNKYLIQGCLISSQLYQCSHNTLVAFATGSMKRRSPRLKNPMEMQCVSLHADKDNQAISVRCPLNWGQHHFEPAKEWHQHCLWLLPPEEGKAHPARKYEFSQLWSAVTMIWNAFSPLCNRCEGKARNSRKKRLSAGIW